jgi:hypothetical protein
MPGTECFDLSGRSPGISTAVDFRDEQEVQHMAPLTLEKIYTELRAGIRETDNISFRLLGLVPLVSGAALIGVILKEGTLGPVVTLLSLFAAGVTLGIFRWELRNTQTCK